MKHKRRKERILNCRSGEYEGLSKGLIDPQWKPDFDLPNLTNL